MKKSFKVHQDPGHGWMAVKRKDLQELGIESQISLCSYVSKTNKTVYLEEDRDMSIFLQAYVAKFGVEPALEFKHTDRRSPIRSLHAFGFVANEEVKNEQI